MEILALSLLTALGVLSAVQWGKKCINPKGNDEESYIEGCLKMTCKAGVWKSSLEEQIQEIKHLLVKHLEQTDCDRELQVSTSTTSTATSLGTEGFLMSGGCSGCGRCSGCEEQALTSVEVFIPENGKTCTLPDLPFGLFGHSMNIVGDNLVVCGGTVGEVLEDSDESNQKACLHLSPSSSSEWTSYATLMKRRILHTGWVSPSGELLLVGSYNKGDQDAEIVNAGTSTLRNISLKQETRGHCGIDAGDSVIITGGEFTLRIVARYNFLGHIENLPEMNHERSWHGCSSYQSDASMVLIVAGGYNGFTETTLSSTERMAIGAAAWTTLNALPRALCFMGSLTVGNLVYLTGGFDEDKVDRSEILVLDGEDWREVGHLEMASAHHAVTRMDTARFIEFCN